MSITKTKSEIGLNRNELKQSKYKRKEWPKTDYAQSENRRERKER